MNLHDEAAFISWVIGVLQAGGLTVGDGVAPTNVPAGSGYCVVYSIAGGITGGTIMDPNDDAAPNFQVTSSSTHAGQARGLVKKVRNLLATAVPAVIGDRKAIWINFPMASVTQVVDHDVQPPRFGYPDRFIIGTVPA